MYLLFTAKSAQNANPPSRCVFKRRHLHPRSPQQVVVSVSRVHGLASLRSHRTRSRHGIKRVNKIAFVSMCVLFLLCCKCWYWRLFGRSTIFFNLHIPDCISREVWHSQISFNTHRTFGFGYFLVLVISQQFLVPMHLAFRIFLGVVFVVSLGLTFGLKLQYDCTKCEAIGFGKLWTISWFVRLPCWGEIVAKIKLQ